MGSRTPNQFGARLVPISRWEEVPLLGDSELTLPKNPNGGPLFSTWEVLRDAFIRGTLASTYINSLPAKQPGVCRPCARSKHYQAYSERREQKVGARCATPTEDNPRLDDCLQGSCNRRPQPG